MKKGDLGEKGTSLQKEREKIDDGKNMGSKVGGSIKAEMKGQSMIASDIYHRPNVPASSDQVPLGDSIDLHFTLLKIDYATVKSEYTLAQASIQSLTKDLACKEDLIANLKSLQALSDENAAKSKRQMQNNLNALKTVLSKITTQSASATISLFQDKLAQNNEIALRMKEKIENILRAAEQETTIERLKGECEVWRQKVILSESKLTRIEEVQSQVYRLRDKVQIQEQEKAQAKTVFDALQSIWKEISSPGEDLLNAETKKIVISRIKAQSKEHEEMAALLWKIQTKLGLEKVKYDEVAYVQTINSLLKDQECLYQMKSQKEKVEEEFRTLGGLFNIPRKPITKGKASLQPPQFDLASYSEEIKREISSALERERSLNIQLADETQTNQQAIRKLDANNKELAKKLEEAGKSIEDSKSMNSKLASQMEQAKRNSEGLARTKELLSKSEADLLEANQNLRTAKDRIQKTEEQLTAMRKTLVETENNAKLNLSSTVKQASEEKIKELSEVKAKLTKEHQLQLRKATDQLSSRHLFEINRLKDESKHLFTQASKSQSKIATEAEREKTRAMNQLKEELRRKHEEVVKQMMETHRKQLSRMESDCEEKVKKGNSLIKQGERSYEQFAGKVERSFESLSESFSSICQRKILLSLGNLDGGVQQIISTIEDILATAKFFPNSDAFGEDMMERKAFLVNEMEKYVREKVRVTKLIYHNDPLNPKSFHNYVDNRQHLLIVCRLMNGKVIASYTAQAFREIAKADDPLEGRGLLFSVTDKEVYQVKKTHNRNVIAYDPFYLIVGNAELRIRTNDMKLYTNFAIVNSFFDERGHKVKNFVGQDLRGVDMACYEVYQIHFKNAPL